MSEGEMYVDPEELRYKARPFELAAREWEEIGLSLDDIRVRCWAVWGGDDLGEKFRPSFDAGVDNVAQGVRGLGRTLMYHADGLVQNSELFGQARDDADQASYQYLTESDGLGTPAPQQITQLSPVQTHQQGQSSERLAPRNGPAGADEDAVVPRQQARVVRGRTLPDPDAPVEPPRQFLRSTRASVPDPGCEPAQQGRRVLSRLALTPAKGADPPPGQYWSDGDWVYAHGSEPLLLSKLDSPYEHGAPHIADEPGTVPQPAQGVFPPPGQLWYDGVYLYDSDGAILSVAMLDSPYDHI